MSAPGTRVALLGATGHVGMCITAGLLLQSAYRLTEVARDTSRAAAFLRELPPHRETDICTFEQFPHGEFDVIINCVGAGDPNAVRALGASIAEVTQHFDDIVDDYLRGRPGTRAIHISSGAVYGGDFHAPAREADAQRMGELQISPADHYAAAKRTSELRHRLNADAAIVDLRVFGLFSRYIRIDAGFFMSHVCRAILDGTELSVDPHDIMRDYVHPTDLAALTAAVIESSPRNDVFDVYSVAPVGKFAVLDALAERHGLRYRVSQDSLASGTAGVKPQYYSMNHHAAALGYAPRWDSLQTVLGEVDALVRAHTPD